MKYIPSCIPLYLFSSNHPTLFSQKVPEVSGIPSSLGIGKEEGGRAAQARSAIHLTVINVRKAQFTPKPPNLPTPTNAAPLSPLCSATRATQRLRGSASHLPGVWKSPVPRIDYSMRLQWKCPVTKSTRESFLRFE